jgi:hypothetical protein
MNSLNQVLLEKGNPNKIPKNDIRYEILKTIPEKEYDEDSAYVYLLINGEKDYFVVSINATIQIQIIWYPANHDNRVVRIWAAVYDHPSSPNLKKLPAEEKQEEYNDEKISRFCLKYLESLQRVREDKYNELSDYSDYEEFSD